MESEGIVVDNLLILKYLGVVFMFKGSGRFEICSRVPGITNSKTPNISTYQLKSLEDQSASGHYFWSL